MHTRALAHLTLSDILLFYLAITASAGSYDYQSCSSRGTFRAADSLAKATLSGNSPVCACTRDRAVDGTLWCSHRDGSCSGSAPFRSRLEMMRVGE